MARSSQLARAYLQKQEWDEQPVDTVPWYHVDTGLLSSSLSQTFLPSTFDSETEIFLHRAKEITDSVCLQIYYSFASTVLSLFMTKTSINGFLKRGSMFLFSHHQLSGLLSRLVPEGKEGTLLDLGAGDGAITEYLSSFFNQTLATEASAPMRWRLQERGFSIIDLDTWWHPSNYDRLDLIACLNLLDRHPEPRKLLGQLRNLSLAKGGTPIMMASVFPWYQFSEFSVGNTPSDHLYLKSKGFEAQASEFVAEVLEPAGFQVLRWTRLPYLCEGDTYQSYYYLYDAVFILIPDQTSIE